MTEVDSAMLDKVMTPEQRAEFMAEYRSELARKHKLGREAARIAEEVKDNNTRVAALELLTGGLGLNGEWGSRAKDVTFSDSKRAINDYLASKYDFVSTEYVVARSEYARRFELSMRDEFPVTPEDMDRYAERTVDLLETSKWPDSASFWMWALYEGDWKKMVYAEAPALGFVRRNEN